MHAHRHICKFKLLREGAESHFFHSLQTTDRRTQKTAPCLRWAEPPQPPADVLRAGEQKRFRFAEKLFLVLFIDSKHSW